MGIRGIELQSPNPPRQKHGDFASDFLARRQIPTNLNLSMPVSAAMLAGMIPCRRK
jgi:hypothetical protein